MHKIYELTLDHEVIKKYYKYLLLKEGLTILLPVTLFFICLGIIGLIFLEALIYLLLPIAIALVFDLSTYLVNRSSRKVALVELDNPIEYKYLFNESGFIVMTFDIEDFYEYSEITISKLKEFYRIRTKDGFYLIKKTDLDTDTFKEIKRRR